MKLALSKRELEIIIECVGFTNHTPEMKRLQERLIKAWQKETSNAKDKTKIPK